MKKSWRQLMFQKKGQPPPRWVRTTGGATPIDPRSRRRMRYGTARLAANRGSERLHRLIRSAFFAVLELVAVIVLVTWAASFIWHFYEGAEAGRAVLQGILAAVAVCVWLVFTRERYRYEQHKAIAVERELERRADEASATERTTRMDRVDPAGPPPPIRSSATWPPDRRGDDQPPDRAPDPPDWPNPYADKPQGFVDPRNLPEERL